MSNEYTDKEIPNIANLFNLESDFSQIVDSFHLIYKIKLCISDTQDYLDKLNEIEDGEIGKCIIECLNDLDNELKAI